MLFLKFWTHTFGGSQLSFLPNFPVCICVRKCLQKYTSVQWGRRKKGTADAEPAWHILLLLHLANFLHPPPQPLPGNWTRLLAPPSTKNNGRGEGRLKFHVFASIFLFQEGAWNYAKLQFIIQPRHKSVYLGLTSACIRVRTFFPFCGLLKHVEKETSGGRII